MSVSRLGAISVCAFAVLLACGRPGAPSGTEPSGAEVPEKRAPLASEASPDDPPAPPAAAPRSWETCREVREVVKTPRTIRDVDWCNREYTPGWVALRDGIGEIHEYMDLAAAHDTYIYKLADVAYGDLDGDGVEEAVVLIHSESYTGTAAWTGADLYVFALRAGNVVDLGSSPASVADRWTLAIGAGEVTLRFAIPPKACVDRWTFAAGTLVYDGATRCTGP